MATFLLILLDLHCSVQIALLVARLVVAVAVQDGAAALVLCHSRQLIVEIATCLLLVLIQFDGPPLVIQSRIAQVLVAKARVKLIETSCGLIRNYAAGLTAIVAMDRLSASPATRFELRSEHVPCLDIGARSLLKLNLVLDDLVRLLQPVRDALVLRKRDCLLELVRVLNLLQLHVREVALHCVVAEKANLLALSLGCNGGSLHRKTLIAKLLRRELVPIVLHAAPRFLH